MENGHKKDGLRTQVGRGEVCHREKEGVEDGVNKKKVGKIGKGRQRRRKERGWGTHAGFHPGP